MTDALDGTLLGGRVGRPHGLDGSFYVTGARAAMLREGAEVTLTPPGARTRIVRRAGTDARPIVRVEIASDRDGAEALRGGELRVAAAAAPTLEADEYWAEQLVGCRVEAGGALVGTVTAMLELPSCECLEVTRDAGAPLLVPMVRDAVRSIDVQARVIEINLQFLGEQPPADGAEPDRAESDDAT
jgi:16S rRNA processing protein RimM